MKLGAQLYSLRSFLTTPEEIRSTFEKVKQIGYENVQLSGAKCTDPEMLRSVTEDTGMKIVCTHSAYDRITGDTEALIRDHRTFGCPVIGLGAMPKQFRGSQEGFEAFLAELKTPVEKILDAGLHFAYHNHSFEFEKPENGKPTYFDQLLEVCENWQFIMDTYWVEYAGYSAAEYIRKIGGARLPNIHFKDMAKDGARSICHCGAGVLDFKKLAQVCREVGVQNVLVEQDNAVAAADPFGEMDASFRYLRPIIQ